MKRTIYYTDELNDEFSTAQIEPKTIDEGYSYEGGVLRKVGRAFWYHMLAKPLAFVYLKVGFGHRVVGRDKLRGAKGKGYFLYGNHTNAGPDALIPTMLNFNRSVYVIVHPNNVSMPILGKITPSLGAMPLPDTMGAMKNFTNAIKHKIEHREVVMIYPEAHIWPYYTKIRPFKADSFGYPLQYQTPVYCFTNTYQERPFHKRPRMVTYVDGPFYADGTLPRKEQKASLRNQVYDAMVARSANSTVEYIQYVKDNKSYKKRKT